MAVLAQFGAVLVFTGMALEPPFCNLRKTTHRGRRYRSTSFRTQVFYPAVDPVSESPAPDSFCTVNPRPKSGSVDALSKSFSAPGPHRSGAGASPGAGSLAL